MTPDTMIVLTERKPITDLATSWSCKNCGERLGLVGKNNKGWHYLIPLGAMNIRIYGNASITCIFCNQIREWHWDEIAMSKIIEGRRERDV